MEAKQKCAHDPGRNVGFESYSQIRPSTGKLEDKLSLLSFKIRLTAKTQAVMPILRLFTAE